LTKPAAKPIPVKAKKWDGCCIRRQRHVLDPCGRTRRVGEAVAAYSFDLLCCQAFLFLVVGAKVAGDFAWHDSILTYLADDHTVYKVKDEEVIAGLRRGRHYQADSL
jgi:hypothetical protein